MDTFDYGRCTQCDEDNYLRGGSTCARCLGLSYAPVDDQDNEDNEQESSSSFLDPAA